MRNGGPVTMEGIEAIRIFAIKAEPLTIGNNLELYIASLESNLYACGKDD